MEKRDFYTYRIQPIISLIRKDYNKKITIEELEELSNFSYRNLQRVFKAYFNETIGSYIIRIRLENSAKMLLFSSEKIKIIAEKVGYSDVHSYTKSFKKHFGITPAVYRTKKEELFTKNNEVTTMPFYEDRITTFTSQKVIYKTFKGDYESEELDNVWRLLTEEVETLNIDVNQSKSLGIIWDEPIISEKIEYNYDACFIIDEKVEVANKKFRTKYLKSNQYAVFKHFGSYKAISKTYDKIFSNWLFTTNYEVSEDSFLEFYIVNESHTSNYNDFETEIYIPLKINK